MFFKGKDAQLERAIEADDPAVVDAAIANGANPNAVGSTTKPYHRHQWQNRWDGNYEKMRE